VSLLAALDPSALRARVTQRSWWLVRYRDGRVINEWDGPDWSLLPRTGLLAVRLVCPNGKVAELGHPTDASDRLFQLKAGALLGGTRNTTAHLIGIVHDASGRASCAAWEYGPRRLVTFEDNVHQMHYLTIGRLNLDVLGIAPE
jgi:hypothetical protein